MEQIINCFIASPGDTVKEREICIKVIAQINKGIGVAYKFRIKPLTWEQDSRPSFGAYSQAVISEQIGSDYGIFIGIMHQKFGSPTMVAGSGTEEEFNNAYKKHMSGDDVEIMFYFNDKSPESLDEINIDDLAKIRSFKRSLGEKGGYYWGYSGIINFEDLLTEHLNSYLNNKFLKSSAAIKIDSGFIKTTRIRTNYDARLKKALINFDSQPPIWVDPVISATNKISTNADENYSNRVEIRTIIDEVDSIIIRAPRQFGLTCLAHYLIKEAFELKKTWIYLDSNNLKAHNIHNAASHECEAIGINTDEIECIILDSWNRMDPSDYKKLKNLCDAHKETRLIVMESIDDQKFLGEIDDTFIDREFTQLFLLALPRNQVRKVISEYNKQKGIGEEDIILTKMIADLEVLNMHRTPLNCITLLKVSENKFDDSPVNRTGMLENVLFVLFNMDGIPRHRTRPDLKDCEYILGKFCEEMIRNDSYEFSRDSFIKKLSAFCDEKLIDVEVDVVFDILALNSIIILKNSIYAFKATYWIFYFAAKRMHIDAIFREYIYTSKKYTSFPEIIEFYTGIDRNRSDALEVLCVDIAETCNTVINKVGISSAMNPLDFMKWMPTDEQIDLAQKEIGDIVSKSSLPDDIKDQHADRGYNQVRPYNQSINAFFEEYSVYNLMQKIKASSRALRNSDYVEAGIKSKILNEIMRSWEQISIVLFIIAPALASKGRANLEGASFELAGDFGETFDDKMNLILQVIPTNIVGYFKDDLFSNKIAPLLYTEFRNEANNLKKHSLALFFVLTRPKGWKVEIENYIVSLSKNSFYLFDVVNNLKARYAFDFANESEVRDIDYLMRLGLAKHSTGDKKPSLSKIVNFPPNQLPKRVVKGT